jgi:hypothetical protein
VWTSRGGSYPPVFLTAFKPGRRANVGSKGAIRAHRGSSPDGGDEPGSGHSPALIDELVREGARRMLAEVDDDVARHINERDEAGQRLVVRNGSHQPREVLTSIGAVVGGSAPVMPPAVGYAQPCSRSATACWGTGARCARFAGSLSIALDQQEIGDVRPLPQLPAVALLAPDARFLSPVHVNGVA